MKSCAWRRGPLPIAIAITVAFPGKAWAARGVEAVIASACSRPDSGPALRARLAEAVLVQAGALGSDVLSDPTLAQASSFDARVLIAAHRGTVNGRTFEDDIRALTQRLEDMLGRTSGVPEADRNITVSNPPAGRGWLFNPATSITLTCTAPKPAKPIIAQFEIPGARPSFVLRAKVEELGLTGDAAKTAGAAMVSLKRTRTDKDDGSRKTDTSLGVSGTAGIRLTPVTAASPIFGYASYALSRERTNPAPETSQSDGDVHALELGISAQSLLLRSSDDFSVVGGIQGGFVRNFAKNASSVKFRGSLIPGLATSLRPVCGIGGFDEVTALNLRFRTRCTIILEAEGGHILKRGDLGISDHDTYLGLGGSLGYEVAAPMGNDAVVIGKIGYRYLPIILGDARNIKRWEAALKYRYWLPQGPGLDFGATWVKGTEPVSYAEEDKLELGFGIIF